MAEEMEDEEEERERGCGVEMNRTQQWTETFREMKCTMK